MPKEHHEHGLQSVEVKVTQHSIEYAIYAKSGEIRNHIYKTNN